MSSCAEKTIIVLTTMILFYISGDSGYDIAIGVFINKINVFNADLFEFKYLPNSPLGDFLPVPLESFFVLLSHFPRSYLCIGVFYMAFDPCSVTVGR